MSNVKVDPEREHQVQLDHSSGSIKEHVDPVERKHRIQLELSPGAIEEIDKLGKTLGVTSRAAVIRFALGVLKLNCEEQERTGRGIRLAPALR